MDNPDLDGTIWFSHILSRSEYLPYTYPQPQHDPSLAGDPWQMSVKGVPQSADRFPAEIYWKDKSRRAIPPGHVSRPGIYVVSESVAQVLRDFDLGQTRLYPTQFFEFDQKTPLPGQYYCLAIGETKSGVVVEKSKTRDSYPRGTARAAPSSPEDGDLALRRSALGGVDFWLDSDVHLALFLTGRLVAALRAAKVDQYFFLTKCIVLDE